MTGGDDESQIAGSDGSAGPGNGGWAERFYLGLIADRMVNREYAARFRREVAGKLGVEADK